MMFFSGLQSGIVLSIGETSTRSGTAKGLEILVPIAIHGNCCAMAVSKKSNSELVMVTGKKGCTGVLYTASLPPPSDTVKTPPRVARCCEGGVVETHLSSIWTGQARSRTDRLLIDLDRGSRDLKLPYILERVKRLLPVNFYPGKQAWFILLTLT